jgi:hypothetical protein
VHREQSTSALAEQAVAANCPATEHTLHLVPELTPWRQNWPVSHGSHRQPEGEPASVTRMNPAEQVHVDDTRVELGGHVQSDAEDAPGADILPPEQRVALPPPGQKKPSAHGPHSAPNVPARHTNMHFPAFSTYPSAHLHGQPEMFGPLPLYTVFAGSTLVHGEQIASISPPQPPER